MAFILPAQKVVTREVVEREIVISVMRRLLRKCLELFQNLRIPKDGVRIYFFVMFSCVARLSFFPIFTLILFGISVTD